MKYYKRENNNNKKIYYVNNKNEIIKNNKIIDQIKSFKIPPAWKNVQINPNSNKIIATGFDIKGKKQYIYSNTHVLNKSYEKFCEQKLFGKYIPKIKKDIEKELKNKNNTKNKLIALILKIILICNFRIGTENCRKNNNSYGVSTIIKKQIILENNNTKIEFVGKKGVINKCLIKDKNINEIIKNLYNSRRNSEELFKLNNKKITNLDVNNYLKKYNNKITTKDFRTWAANTLFLKSILNNEISDKLSKRKKDLREAIKYVSSKLHHTPAVCKKKYLLNNLLDLYIEKPKRFKKYIVNNKSTKYSLEELIFLKYLNSYCK